MSARADPRFRQVKKACAMANMQLKAMKPSKAEAIIAACDEIIENGRCMDQFPVDQFQGVPAPPST